MQGKKTLVVAILAVVSLAIPLVSFAASGPGKGGSNPVGFDPECGPGLPPTVTLELSCTAPDPVATGNVGADGRFRRVAGLAKDMVIEVTAACVDFAGSCGDLQVGTCTAPVDNESACALAQGVDYSFKGTTTTPASSFIDTTAEASIAPGDLAAGDPAFVGGAGIKFINTTVNDHWKCAQAGHTVSIYRTATLIFTCTWQPKP